MLTGRLLGPLIMISLAIPIVDITLAPAVLIRFLDSPCWMTHMHQYERREFESKRHNGELIIVKRL